MFKRIYIEITNICNLHCSFCPSTTRNKSFMTTKQFKMIMEKIKGYTEYIYLHVMGEPLMHPELDEILDIASNYNMKVIITTNGRLLKDKIDIINKHHIYKLNISLHSYDLNHLDDIKDLINTIKLITNKSIISLRLWNLKEESNNQKIIDYLTQEFNLKALSNINDKGIKLKDNLYINQDVEFKWPSLEYEATNEKGTCYGLRTQIGILVDGTVVPCCLDNNGYNNLGNIFTSSLDIIINSNKCKEIRDGFRNKKLVSSLCKRCNYVTRFNKDDN